MGNNKIYIAAAGSGKTTFILKQVIERYQAGLPDNKRILIITYTSNNQSNIIARLQANFGFIPKGIEIIGWYTFLLDYWIRPFKGTVIEQLYSTHVGMTLVEGISGHITIEGKTFTTYHNDPEKFLDSEQRNLFSDKLSEFAYKCWYSNKSTLLPRLENIVDTIYIDEGQDLAAWDFELMKVLFTKSEINCIVCGDPRQNTYTTSPSTKHSAYVGDIAKFAADCINTRRRSYVALDYDTLSCTHRCVSEICAFASAITNDYPATTCCDCEKCNEKRSMYMLPKGMFVLKEQDAQRYVEVYDPVSLVWQRNTSILVQTRYQYNFGESKGLQFPSTIIYPTISFLKAYTKGKNIKPLNHVSRCKYYVAITRARFASAIVVPDNFDNTLIGLPFWHE